MIHTGGTLGMSKHRTMGHSPQNRRERRKFVAALNRSADAVVRMRRRRANRQYPSVLELMRAESR